MVDGGSVRLLMLRFLFGYTVSVVYSLLNCHWPLFTDLRLLIGGALFFDRIPLENTHRRFRASPHPPLVDAHARVVGRIHLHTWGADTVAALSLRNCCVPTISTCADQRIERRQQ